jgi:uncharacterized protein YegL
MEEYQVGASNFKFSGKRIDDLGASEYTLVTLVIDVSGSVASFAKEIEKAVKEVVISCRRSPRADNLMLQVVMFDSHVVEFHGYKPLTECAEDDYDGCITPGGVTALYDATYNGVKSMTQYGKDLMDQDFDCNGAVFVITDGMDNDSKLTQNLVKQAFTEAVTGEALESLVSVLIGVNTIADGLGSYLQDFKDDAGFSQYVAIADATEKQLAKLGAFISQSISSQSQALGTGGPSKSLSF